MQSTRRPYGVAALASMAVGISYIGMGAGSLVSPDVQTSGTIDEFLRSLTDDQLGFKILFWSMALGALFALAAVPAIADLGSRAWAPWARNLGIVGFAVAAVNAFRILFLVPENAENYLLVPDDAARFAIRSDYFNLTLDPNSLFSFGLVGLFIVMTIIGARHLRTIPTPLFLVGIGGGVCYLLVVLAGFLEQEILVTIAAVAGGLVLAPIFYIWVGVILWRWAGDDMTLAIEHADAASVV